MGNLGIISLIQDINVKLSSSSFRWYIDMHYLYHHVRGTHIIIAHTRNTNARVTLNCTYVLCTSVGLSVDCK